VLLFDLAQPLFQVSQALRDGNEMLDQMTNGLLWCDFTE